jgi:YesN/AraC family two-component response regulator
MGVDYLLGKPFTVEDVETVLRKIRARVSARTTLEAA